MKKIVYLFLIAISVASALFFNSNKVSMADSGVGQLNRFSNVLNKKDISITSWNLYAREAKIKTSVAKVIGVYKNNFQNFKWTEQDNGKKIIGTFNRQFVTERIVVTSTGRSSSYVIYEISGTKWDQQTEKETKNLIKNSMENIFSKEPTFFTCIKGTMNGKLEGVLQGAKNDFLETFKAKKIEEIKEGAFVSVSAYTEQWNDALIANGKKINLQIAIREDKVDNSTTIIIGTPIITVEY
ncbi:YwmB family TATA-box binding protein [Gottfriedia luciferensis]|uniref:YwmB family TATA-box binding protein n=1 Tax=Gottfriedia luciferensis TaxID=178774 RepID=UPI0013028DF7|nr:YwmB family TATA-box binding protein [Gottfriedia luciferensis]